MRRSINLRSSLSAASSADNESFNQQQLNSQAAPVQRQTIAPGGHAHSSAQASVVGGNAALDIEEFLMHFSAEHPLQQQGLSKFALLVKNEDFHLYSVEKSGRPLLLKVMCDPDLFYAELAVFNRIQTLTAGSEELRQEKVALRLRNYFQFQTPLYDDAASSQQSSDAGIAELDHFYLLFETCSTNLYQMIAMRKQKFEQMLRKQGAGPGACAQSISSFNTNVVRLQEATMNMFSESDLMRIVTRLVDLFAQLQKAKIAHRNIKPANLVYSSQPDTSAHPSTMPKKSKACQFEDLIVSNFEMATCFPVNATYAEMICSQDDKCSAIYASPLVQKKVNFLAEKADRDSDIVIEVAEN